MNLQNIRLIGDKILVKVHENSDMSDGGIYVGQATTTFVNGRERAVQKTVGTVVAVGTGVEIEHGKRKGFRRPIDVEVGQIVCFSDTCGRYVDDEHLWIREGDVAFFMDEAATVELNYDPPEKSTYTT
jgi:co-chaperonin GroES (HSP10)